MILEFNNLEFTTDKNKAIPKLEHEFTPFPSEPSVVLKCEYFKSGELMQYMDIDAKGKFSYKYREIVEDKVKHISGISMKDKKTGKEVPIEDIETFLNLPSTTFAEQLITVVAAHLITGDSLNEEEVKN